MVTDWTLVERTGSYQISRVVIGKLKIGVDLLDLFPTDVAKRDKAKVDAWTYGAFLEAAKKLHNAGYPFVNPINKVSDANGLALSTISVLRVCANKQRWKRYHRI